MTCVYCRVKDKWSVYIKTIPSCIQEKKGIETFLLRLNTYDLTRISESTFPSKIPSQNS